MPSGARALTRTAGPADERVTPSFMASSGLETVTVQRRLDWTWSSMSPTAARRYSDAASCDSTGEPLMSMSTSPGASTPCARPLSATCCTRVVPRSSVVMVMPVGTSGPGLCRRNLTTRSLSREEITISRSPTADRSKCVASSWVCTIVSLIETTTSSTASTPAATPSSRSIALTNGWPRLSVMSVIPVLVRALALTKWTVDRKKELTPSRMRPAAARSISVPCSCDSTGTPFTESSTSPTCSRAAPAPSSSIAVIRTNMPDGSLLSVMPVRPPGGLMMATRACVHCCLDLLASLAQSSICEA
mmetsp:Transcript_22373/g.55142  ORF Transcript_22373/g.55142 Transcript_22373/m.55142 type:complete len:303 (+) Transcript_22373:736-1644(+)